MIAERPLRWAIVSKRSSAELKVDKRSKEECLRPTPTLDTSTIVKPTQGLLEQAVYFQFKVKAASSDC